MKKIKMFDLIEKSFLSLPKMNRKTWIIGIIISMLSGGLTISESFDKVSYNENDILGNEMMDIFLSESLGYIISFVLIAILILIAIMFVFGVFSYVATYYLYHSTYEDLFDIKLDKAPLGLVVKVNFIVCLKILLGLILFIIPGIITGLKYAPVNYILCKNSELSSKEILNKSKALSKGFKWKIFVYSVFLSIISGITILLCSPNSFVKGYILIDVLSMLITFVITIFTVVYVSVFDIYLYNDIENLKEINMA